MERLIYSKPIPCKFHRNSALLPRVTRSKWIPTPETFSSRSLTSFSWLPRRFRSLSLSHNEVCFLDSKGLSSAIESANEAETEIHSLQRVAPKLSHKIRVINGGLLRLLSPILLTFIVFAFAPPSFASLRNTTRGGGSAAVVAVGRHLIRSELLNSAWTGFFAGCLHTLSGPDHLAALAPLSIGRTRIESAAVGALWGCGHDAGQVLFGLLFLLLKDRLHIEVIRTWGSIVVGFTLIVIGAIGIKEASEASVQSLSAENGESVVGEYEAAALAIPSYEKKKKKIGFATFATGIVHGLQPDALMMILPALALPSRLAGAAFLLMFLVGTVFSMGSYTVFIGSCSQALKDRMPRITEKLTWVSSLVAIALGLAIIVSQFLGFSLY